MHKEMIRIIGGNNSTRFKYPKHSKKELSYKKRYLGPDELQQRTKDKRKSVLNNLKEFDKKSFIDQQNFK
jgi:hypothetical protein